MTRICLGPAAYESSGLALLASSHFIFNRVATAMNVDPNEVEISLYLEHHDVTRTLVPFYSGQNKGAGGLYYHDPDHRPRLAINESELKDPM